MAGMNLRMPTVNQILALAITLAALLFVIRTFAPDGLKQWFRV